MNDGEQLPVFPLRTVLFPDGPLPLKIFETRYVDMISRCMRTREPFVVAAIHEGDETGTASFHAVATLARIDDFERLPDGLLGVVAIGGERVRIVAEERRADGLYIGRAVTLPREKSLATPGDAGDLVALLRDLLQQLPAAYYRDRPQAFDDATWVGYRLAETLPLSLVQKQYFLELEDAAHRLAVLRAVLESMQILPRP